MLSGTKGGRPWQAGIRDPRGPRDSYFAIAGVKDHAFSTAGDYERFFFIDGKRYHHIIDPKTGYPATGARSVTIYAPDATTADGLDDAVLILGPEKGMKLIESLRDVGAVIVDMDNKVHISKRLQDVVKILKDPTPGP
jgi:thiamine biosynthesis lipoprotein